MINHNFDLQPGMVFDPWDERVVSVEYQFLGSKEFMYVVSFVVPSGSCFININLNRILNADVRMCGLSVTMFPELSNVSIANDQYLIEKFFVASKRKLASLWTNFAGSSVDPEDSLPVLNL